MTYKIIKEFNHDKQAYTQGLEFYNNFLFESTGLNGKSSIRRTNLSNGEVLDITNLDYEYFGEGLTVLNDKIYQLTWKNRIGFTYDLNLNKEMKVTNDARAFSPLYIGNNHLFYISTKDGSQNIYLLELESKNTTKITDFNKQEAISGLSYDLFNNRLLYDITTHHFKDIYLLKFKSYSYIS